MKKCIVFIFSVLLLAPGLTGQNSGRGFNFQAVARNADGSVQSEQTIQLSIGIYPSEEKTAVLYQENNSVLTDKFGVFSLVIGNGVYEAGSASELAEIDFSMVNAWLNVVLNSGGDDIEIVHAPLLSVPYAESSTQADNGMPIGAIISYAGAVADNSDDITVYGCKGTWRLCNGAVYDPGEFANLHLVLNDAWGTNRLPDLRGTFLRGTTYSASDTLSDPDKADRKERYAGGNTGDQVGSYQNDAMQNVTGIFGVLNSARVYYNFGISGPFEEESYGDGLGQSWSSSSDPYTTVDFDLSRAARTSTETRPANANVNFIIRVK